MPQWCNTMPLPKMIAKGLTFHRLDKILDRINNISIQNTGYLLPQWIIIALMVIPLLFMFIMMIIAFSGDPNLIIVGAVVWGVGFVVGIALARWKRRKRSKGLALTRRYIEMDLNDEYQSKGIRWSVVDEQRQRYHSNSNYSYFVMHIVVTVLDDDANDIQVKVANDTREGRPDEFFN